MYEQYTDKQIVEMLKPKLEKLGFTEFIKQPENYPMVSRLCATLYKSGYIRGQLGRSFIIGEKKQGKWVPATKDNIKVGSKVRMTDEAAHKSNPNCYPFVGVVGVVIDNSVCQILPLIQWPKNSVGGNDATHCLSRCLEVLLCE